MKKRTLPYGYEMRNGQIAENGSEAETVRMLFRGYANGASYRDLALRMEANGIPFSGSDKGWNKNKIARILNCELYTGTEDYPALIDRELYDKTQARKPACGETSEDARRVKELREMSRCAVCGGEIRMIYGRNGSKRWNCAKCEGLSAKAESGRIVGQIRAICQALYAGEIEITEPGGDAPESETLKKAEADFDALLDQDNFNETAAMEAAMKLASIRYENIDSGQYETERIQYLLEQAHPTEEPEEYVSLLKAIASCILILPDGDVQIRLKNKQMIGGVKHEQRRAECRCDSGKA